MTKQTDQPSTIEKILSHPATSMILAAASVSHPLAGIAPIIGIAKEAISLAATRTKQRREENLKQGASGIDLDQIPITDELVFSTYLVWEKSSNTYQEEKIKLFGRLLKAGITKNELATDKFEEFADILDMLSISELHILQTLYAYEQKYYQESHSDADKYQILGNFWNEFLIEIQEQHNISKDYTEAKLTRLNRTGLYRTFTGMYLGYKGDKGQTTALFKEFAEWIELENDSE